MNDHQPAADRLMDAVLRSTPPHVPLLGRSQVAVVAHALADQTALLNAVHFSGDPDPAVCVGRWLHALGDQLEADRG